jgi:hypothetical protein
MRGVDYMEEATLDCAVNYQRFEIEKLRKRPIAE